MKLNSNKLTNGWCAAAQILNDVSSVSHQLPQLRFVMRFITACFCSYLLCALMSSPVDGSRILERSILNKQPKEMIGTGGLEKLKDRIINEALAKVVQKAVNIIIGKLRST